VGNPHIPLFREVTGLISEPCGPGTILDSGCSLRRTDDHRSSDVRALVEVLDGRGDAAQSVIAMRLTSIALGRGAQAETTRMVSEKVGAFVEAARTLATGGSAHKVVRGYRKHVLANGRRLRQRPDSLRQTAENVETAA
jgi:hypothetical protein